MTLRVINPRHAEPTLKGWHVLAAALAFFGVIFAVNGVLLYQALATHSGLVAKEPYRKGLQYNARISANERQQALGWSETVAVDRAGAVFLEITGAGGAPVTGLEVKGLLGRPSTSRHDIPIALAEIRPGVYTAAVGRLAEGAWMLLVEGHPAQAGGADHPTYRLKRRLWLKP